MTGLAPGDEVAAGARLFRDPALVRDLVVAIRDEVAALGRPLTLMEVCGTHTVAISRSGIRELLRGLVDLRSGPGCPVCVTAEADIDRMVALAGLPDTVVLTYGDMLRVPGDRGTLEEARARGADVRVVYSAGEAVKAAAADPSRRHVFLGVGFETTAPGAALAVLEAALRGLDNFLVYSAHKTLPAALRALLEPSARARAARTPVEGFLLPGHVSAVIGRGAYDFLATEFGLPGAVTGFEPVEILLAVRELARLSRAGGAGRRVLNLYPRVVREEGNPRAQAVIEEVFRPCPAEWRGLGRIEASGLALRPRWSTFDAASRLASELGRVAASRSTPCSPGEADPKGPLPDPDRAAARRACRCGDVLRGDLLPPDCPLFGRACTPAAPVGPCMVSSEGSCSAYYRYDRGSAGPKHIRR